MKKQMKVEIKSALWYKTEISGTFPLCAGYKADSASKRDGYIWIEADFGHNGAAKKTRVAINEGDFEMLNSNGKAKASATVLTDKEISQEIEDRFEVLTLLTDGVIKRQIKALIVSGAAGIGKTYNIEHQLEKAEAAGKISKFSMLTGSCSAVGLFLQLWNHQNEGNVLVLDDIDSIFNDEEALNLLKGALDTGRRRSITWTKDSSFLEKEGIDRSFDFHGTVIFITNHNFDALIDKGNKLSVHYEALISRCMYLDLGIHSMREVIIRIRQVIAKTDMMSKLGINKAETDHMMDWMMNNTDTLRKVDLRTMIKLAHIYKTSRKGWQMVAKAALCRR